MSLNTKYAGNSRAKEPVMVLNKVTDTGMTEDLTSSLSSNFGTERDPREGGCYKGDGSAYVDIGYIPSLSLENIEIEFYYLTPTLTGFDSPVAINASIDNNSGIFFVQNNAQLGCNYRHSTGGATAVAYVVPQANTWYKIRVKRTGFNFEMYVDDILVDTETVSFSVQWNPSSFTSILGHSQPNITIGSRVVFGLNVNELDSSGNFVQNLAFYKCDEKSGAVAYDSSGNGNHGTIVNAITVPKEEDPNSIHQRQDVYSWQNTIGYSGPYTSTVVNDSTYSALPTRFGQTLVINGAASGATITAQQIAGETAWKYTNGGVWSGGFLTQFNNRNDEWTKKLRIRCRVYVPSGQPINTITMSGVAGSGFTGSSKIWDANNDPFDEWVDIWAESDTVKGAYSNFHILSNTGSNYDFEFYFQDYQIFVVEELGAYIPRDESIQLPPFRDVLNGPLQYIGHCQNNADWVNSGCFKGDESGYATFNAISMNRLDVFSFECYIHDSLEVNHIIFGSGSGTRYVLIGPTGFQFWWWGQIGDSGILNIDGVSGYAGKYTAIGNGTNIVISRELDGVIVSTTISYGSDTSWSYSQFGKGKIGAISGVVNSSGVQISGVKLTTPTGNYNWPLSEPIKDATNHIYFDKSDNDNHATLVNGSLANYGRQNEYHDLMVNGFSKGVNLDQNLYPVIIDSGDGNPSGWAPTVGGGGPTALTSIINNIWRIEDNPASTFNSVVLRIFTDEFSIGDTYNVEYKLRGSGTFNISLSLGTTQNQILVDTEWQTGTIEGANITNDLIGRIFYNSISTPGQWFEFEYIRFVLKPSHYVPASSADPTKDALGNPLTHPQDGTKFLDCGTDYRPRPIPELIQNDQDLVLFDINGNPKDQTFDGTSYGALLGKYFAGDESIDEGFIKPISLHKEALVRAQFDTELRVRNVENISQYSLDKLVVEVLVDAGDTLSFTSATNAQGTEDYLLDFGEGDGEIRVQNADGAVFSNTYTNAGTYNITIRGTSRLGFNMDNKDKIRRIIQWGTPKVQNLNFVGSSNLTSVPDNQITIEAIGVEGINGQSLFRECTSLTTVPDVFKGSQFESLSRAFENCTGITGSIPSSMLEGCNLLIDVTSLFFGCTNMTGGIPGGMFAGCTALTTVSRTFRNCFGLTGTIGSGLFDDAPITVASGCFNNCQNITGSIPSGMFAGKTTLTNVADGAAYNGLFYNCNKLTGSIPSNLFQGCTNLVHAGNGNVNTGLFAKCTSLTGGVPALFADSPNLQYARDLFDGCTGLNGTIDAGLFGTTTLITRLDNVFRNCTNLTGEIPSGLLSNLTGLQITTSMFQNCSGLISIGSTLFDGLIALTTTSNMFNGCSGLTSGIPANTFASTNLVTVTSMFKDCSGLTGSLPAILFSGKTSLQDVSGVFHSCSGLTGSIPSDLFDGCTSLVYASSTGAYAGGFYNCSGLSINITTDTFNNCTALQVLSSSNFQSSLFHNVNITGVASGAFASCSALTRVDDIFAFHSEITSFPSDVFNPTDNPNITSFQTSFRECTGITGNLPDLWNQTWTASPTTSSCFSGCVNAANWASVPVAWGGPA